MKKQYEAPKMDVIDINRCDIITDSTGEDVNPGGNDDINID
jgi:hypothetical protein